MRVMPSNEIRLSLPEASCAGAADTVKTRLVAQLIWRAREWSRRHLQIGSSAIHWDVLVAIASLPEMRINYAELERMIERPHRTLQYVVRDLEASGLLVQQRASTDRRRMVIELTQQGREVILKYTAYVEAQMRKVTEAGVGLPVGAVDDAVR